MTLHEFLITFFWVSHDFLMTHKWFSHDFTMTFSRLSHAFLITLSWTSHDYENRIQLFFSSSLVFLLCSTMTRETSLASSSFLSQSSLLKRTWTKIDKYYLKLLSVQKKSWSIGQKPQHLFFFLNIKRKVFFFSFKFYSYEHIFLILLFY